MTAQTLYSNMSGMEKREAVNVLMVDDQPAKLLSYEAILEVLGENLIKAHSGKEALDCLLKTDVAVVLVDVSMPELDGFELAEMIQQHPRFQKTAIIFISAVHMTDADRLRGYQRGAVDYISVPVIPDLLRAKVRLFTELHRKANEMEALNRELRVLSGRLIASQDEERRRIARELHDSVGQSIAAISMNNCLVLRHEQALPQAAQNAVRQNMTLIDQVSREIRTISHLLHPPLLDEIGLIPAIRSYAEGFAERSKVQVSLDLPSAIGRFGPNIEISVFRVVQECLTNVYRHSGSAKAAIRVALTADKRLVVEVSDEGKGMSLSDRLSIASGEKHGVGLSGMRERVRELGGSLRIHSHEHGLRVTASLPISEAQDVVVQGMRSSIDAAARKVERDA